MAEYDVDIGIIGGGSGGLTVAAGASQFGAKTLLVEKERELGGDCLHFGCVPSKTLIKTAHIYHSMRNSKAFGLPSVELPPVDFREVSKRIQSVISTIQKHDSKERFCSLGCFVSSFAAVPDDDMSNIMALPRTLVCLRTRLISDLSIPVNLFSCSMAVFSYLLFEGKSTSILL